MAHPTLPMVRGWQPAQVPPRRLRRPFRLLWLLLFPLLLTIRLSVPSAQDVQVYPLHAPASTAAVPADTAPLPDAVRTALPDLPLHALAVPHRRLMQGKLLLINEAHPLPEGYVPADTFGILSRTQGRVTCRDLAAVSGEETLCALTDMFAAARSDRIVQLTVFAATRSPEQQRILQTDTLADFSRDMPLESALLAARSAVASPDCSEHQTPWAVDIRVCPVWNGLPDDGPLSASAAGRWLQYNCWRFGFILRWPDAAPQPHACRAYHLRYVGRAHAMLIHALDVTLEEYLALLQRHGTLTLYDQNNAPLACAVCTQAGEQQTTFVLPEGEVDDLSLDNLGWAAASCLFSADAAPP